MVEVTLVEVGPRDGLQNEPTPIPSLAKIALVDALAEAGLTRIEAGAFVNPQWVPQMADGEQVFTDIKRRPGVRYAALVPNARGAERALAVKADELAVFAAATDAFSQKNTNCTVAESLARFEPVIAQAKAAGVPVRGYISCVIACPYSGAVDPAQVTRIAEDLRALGCYEISLGDTTGVGTPRQVDQLVNAVSARLPVDKLAVHMHDTYGQALTNIYVALQQGVRVVDSAVAGLGGCPYAPGAAGNVATEDVIYLLNGLGLEHGVDLDKVAAAGRAICQQLGRPSTSKVAQALAARHSSTKNDS
ncbi:hydroxymethylglutaryl-CoA lyase [Marinimicrobium alkaliphilum]|uniref:hydroxymethylglutaryl-CoA lyase n=1 Tax=Marinimicrobium alkaliphilum TaxID=2202654 RepID=UPI000DB92C53|nr:hydroxymethylglutaryl-CoA lyase [Marinimicrobium alkaliphilum]